MPLHLMLSLLFLISALLFGAVGALLHLAAPGLGKNLAPWCISACGVCVITGVALWNV